MTDFLSYAEQTAHYFDRPHEASARTPLHHAAAWRRADFAPDGDWRLRLSPAQVDEVEHALAHAEATGKPMAELSAVDFPLPTLAVEIARWRGTLAEGRGFQIVSGLPVAHLSPESKQRLFWCLGHYLGRPGAQNPQGDLLGHVCDSGADAEDPFVRLYRTRSDIAYHCDAADVVGLMCLSKARRGGRSRIVSSVTVYNELLARRPDLIERLYEPFLLDVRNEDSSGNLRYLPIPPCRHAGGELRTFYHSDYLRSVQRHDDVTPFSEDEQTLLDLYESIAALPELCFEVDFEPGDIQWLSNHTVLHARSAYEDWEDPARKRHLLRLWLSLD